MFISKKGTAIVVSAVLFIGMMVGFVIARDSRDAVAANGNTVDSETLSALYEAVFGRPLDDGAKFHLGKDIKHVLRDLNGSQERRYYSALFKAVKAYEEALRAPGTLSAEDKQKYLDTIDSALATLLAWVETLPEQDICKGSVSSERALEAIKEAYENMNSKAKEAAEHGIFNALDNVGKPHNLKLPSKRCVRPSPTVTPVPTATPNSTPTPTPVPTATPTPTPVPTATPTPTPAP